MDGALVFEAPVERLNMGDVIDIFPAENAESAVRITLFDDELESITLFDPLTGHTRQKLGRFTVFPSSHYVTPRATVLKAVEAIKDASAKGDLDEGIEAEKAAFARVFTSADGREGISAFLGKRSPTWTGS